MPTIIMGVYPEEQSGPIVGLEAGGVPYRLKLGEALAALQRRVADATPARMIRTLYGAPRTAPERHSEPARHLTSAAAPVSPPEGVPGIGRIATREELIRLGAIAVPPERFQ